MTAVGSWDTWVQTLIDGCGCWWVSVKVPSLSVKSRGHLLRVSVRKEVESLQKGHSLHNVHIRDWQSQWKSILLYKL